MGRVRAAKFYALGILIIIAGFYMIMAYPEGHLLNQAGLGGMILGLAVAGIGAVKCRRRVRNEYLDEAYSIDSTRIVEMADMIRPGSYKKIAKQGRAVQEARKGIKEKKTQCPKCRSVLAKVSKFCDSCGYKIRRECRCGILNKPLAKFCCGCGKRL